MGQREQVLRALAELRGRFEEASRIAEAAQQAYRAASRRRLLGDEIYKRALGSYLHDFYTAVENLFRAVADFTGEGLPRGEDWHRRLLEQMRREIEQVRPALLSPDTHQALREYLAFRHVFRNIYGDQLDSERLRRLLHDLPAVAAALRQDFTRFEEFVRRLVSGVDQPDA